MSRELQRRSHAVRAWKELGSCGGRLGWVTHSPILSRLNPQTPLSHPPLPPDPLFAWVQTRTRFSRSASRERLDWRRAAWHCMCASAWFFVCVSQDVLGTRSSPRPLLPELLLEWAHERGCVTVSYRIACHILELIPVAKWAAPFWPACLHVLVVLPGGAVVLAAGGGNSLRAARSSLEVTESVSWSHSLTDRYWTTAREQLSASPAVTGHALLTHAVMTGSITE